MFNLVGIHLFESKFIKINHSISRAKFIMKADAPIFIFLNIGVNDDGFFMFRPPPKCNLIFGSILGGPKTVWYTLDGTLRASF